MSNKKFFRRIIDNIVRFLKNLFTKAGDLLEKTIPVGIEVVQNLKLFLDSPATPLLTALIPGTVDDVIAARLKQILPDVLVRLRIANECVNLSTGDEVVQCAIKHLRTLDPDAKKAKLLDIAAMISAALADGKLTWGEIIMATEYTYQERYNK